MPRHTAADALRDPEPEIKRLTLPFHWQPRSYQRAFMQAMDNGTKRAMIVWSRRLGKDITCWNQLIKMAILAPYCGTYPYIFPHLTQGRRDLWDAKTSPDTGGRPFRSFIPPELVMESSETEMQITLKPMPHQKPMAISNGRGGTKTVGSVIQVMGADRDSKENMRGMGVHGAVLSEHADQDDGVYGDIIEPMLLETKGFAIFNTTPKGKNHAWKQWIFAQNEPDWFTSLVTIETAIRDAEGEDGSQIVTRDQIEAMRRAGRAEEIIQQEYYCSFDGYLHGTVYGDLLKRAHADGRIGRVPYVTGIPVGTMWDIGRTDATAIIFYQIVGSEIRIIDYYANTRQGADHYAKVCQQKPYMYGVMLLPHDARVKGFSANESTEEFLRRSVCRNVVIAKQTPVQQGIDQVRRMFSRFVFDEFHCNQIPNPGVPSLLTALASYRRKWDEDKQDYSGEPVHDQYSHPADALRTGALAWEDKMNFLGELGDSIIKVENDFDPRAITPAGRSLTHGLTL